MKKTIILSLILSAGFLGANANLALTEKANLRNTFGVSLSLNMSKDKEIAREQWTATASVRSDNAKKAFDGDASTRWDTGAMQVSGQHFILDMKVINTVSKIVLDAAGSPNDSPAAYEVYLSDDGIDWGGVVASGIGSTGETVISLENKAGRYIKVVQTLSKGNYWSIHEFRVFGEVRK